MDLAKVTSKGQVTIPIDIRKKLGLKNGDKVLICEGCTHHRQCGDIGTEKLPNWIRKHTGQEIEFHFTDDEDIVNMIKELRKEGVVDR